MVPASSTQSKCISAGGASRQAAYAAVPAHTLSAMPSRIITNDEWLKLDYDNLAKVDLAMALAVFRLANSLETPQLE